MHNHQSVSPWAWVPTLYFAEGIPYFLVNTVSVMLFTRLGVPNSTMALFTGMLYLPWVIKPLWSPFVDVIRTKRWWIITMQVLLSLAFVGLTLSIPHPDASLIAAGETPVSLFSVMLCLFWLTAFASATHDVAADGFYMLALEGRQQSLFVGIRSLFYRLASVFGQGGLIALAGRLEIRSGNIPLAWQLTLLTASVIFALITLWHLFALPRVENEPLKEGRQSGADILRSFARSFATFFTKKGILLALLFMLIYRLPEAFLVKMLPPFLVQDSAVGGLGISTASVGVIYGTIGVIALALGGILGGFYAARFGLKRSLIPMVLAITLPDALYLWLSMAQPDSLIWITVVIFIEQFGYGFGFTAYMLYLMHFAKGEYQTSHYALSTGFMALGMMLPGMAAGYIQEAVGYTGLFWLVMACCLLSIAITFIVRSTLEYETKTNL